MINRCGSNQPLRQHVVLIAFHSFKGDATRAALTHSNVQTENAMSRLKGIEEYLGPELVNKLSAESHDTGNEQYLPDKGKTKCKSF